MCFYYSATHWTFHFESYMKLFAQMSPQGYFCSEPGLGKLHLDILLNIILMFHRIKAIQV